MKYMGLALDLWMGFFQVFFGTPPNFLMRRLNLRPVCAGVVAGTEESGMSVYYLSIIGSGNASKIRQVLTGNLSRFFREQKLQLTAESESIIFRLKGASEVIASLDLLEHGWKFRVPMMSFAGSSYLEAEEKWDAVTIKIYEALLEHLS